MAALPRAASEVAAMKPALFEMRLPVNVLPGLVRTKEPVPSLMRSPAPEMRPESVRPWTVLEEWVAVATERRAPPARVIGPANSSPKVLSFATAIDCPAKVIGVVRAIVLLVARIGLRSE